MLCLSAFMSWNKKSVAGEPTMQERPPCRPPLPPSYNGRLDLTTKGLEFAGRQKKTTFIGNIEKLQPF